MRVPVWAVGLVKLADRTDVDLYGLDEDPPDRVEVATTPLVPAAGEAFTAAELEARIRFYSQRAGRRQELGAAPVGADARRSRARPPVRERCLECGAELSGRSDRVYCSRACKCRAVKARWRALRKGA